MIHDNMFKGIEIGRCLNPCPSHVMLTVDITGSHMQLAASVVAYHSHNLALRRLRWME